MYRNYSTEFCPQYQTQQRLTFLTDLNYSTVYLLLRLFGQEFGCLYDVVVFQRPAMMSVEKGYFYTDASCLVTEYCKHGSVLVGTYTEYQWLGGSHSPSINDWGTHTVQVSSTGGTHTVRVPVSNTEGTHWASHTGGDTLSFKYLRTHTVWVLSTGGAAHLHNPSTLIRIVVGTRMKSEYTRNKYWWV